MASAISKAWLPIIFAIIIHSNLITCSKLISISTESDLDVIAASKHGFTPAPHNIEPHRDVCEEDAECVLPVQCPAHFYQEEERVECKTQNGRIGVCCTSGQNHTEFKSHRGRHRHHFIRHIDRDVLVSVARHSRVEIAEMHMREARMLSSGRAATLPYGSPSYGHFRNSRVFASDLLEVMNVANRALEIALATRAFKDRQGLTTQQLEWSMIHQNLRPTPLGAACAPVLDCPPVPDRYRRIDGACNNLLNPSWGTPLSPFARLLPPSYQDGIWSIRVSEAHGGPLPSPRKISTTLFKDVDSPNRGYTLMLTQFGQFLSHEITQSIDTKYGNGSAISCCDEDGIEEIPEEQRHYSCYPITIDGTDEFYSHFKQGCMNFVRSVLAPRSDCTLGYAQQMNKVTHFIDGSAIYGSNYEQTNELRRYRGGRLRVFRDYGRELLPLSSDKEACLTMEQGSACFESGDTRTNQMISLVAVHTLFLREHNRIAHELSHINPHWSDEKIFLETRKILVAELQVITYNEFLPALLGESTMKEFDIALENNFDYSYDYNQRIEPSITNEFAAAAYRFGHSTVDGNLKIYGQHRMDESISIAETMFFPGRMRKHQFFDQIMSTLTTEPLQDVDAFFTESLTKYMFRSGNPFGVDLVSLNIHRGRDHGLRPYNDYRQLVGLPRYTNFADFGPEFGPQLAALYDHIDDVDLFVGGVLEPKHDGGMLGTTFRDIIADQFVRLKKGDRYFFDHDPSVNPGFFTLEQVMELRKSSMSRLICDNSDGYLLARQTPNVFRTPGPGNEFVDCASTAIPHLNLIHWKEYL